MNATDIEKNCGEAMKKAATFREYAKAHLRAVKDTSKFEAVYNKVNGKSDPAPKARSRSRGADNAATEGGDA